MAERAKPRPLVVNFNIEGLPESLTPLAPTTRCRRSTVLDVLLGVGKGAKSPCRGKGAKSPCGGKGGA